MTLGSTGDMGAGEEPGQDGRIWGLHGTGPPLVQGGIQGHGIGRGCLRPPPLLMHKPPHEGPGLRLSCSSGLRGWDSAVL